MKKALIASTALLLIAGVAHADVINGQDNATVKFSGYGRTGILYQEDGVEGEDTNDAVIQSRLRINADVTTMTDNDVEFGGRIRIQWDQGDGETTVAPGYVYVTASGLTVEIGNSNTAYDSANLLYASEIGVYSRSFGNSRGEFFAYNTDGFPTFDNTTGGGSSTDPRNDYLGIMASYEIAGVSIKASQVDPDQVSSVDGAEKEYGVSLGYVWNETITLSAAGLKDGAGIDGNDQFFVGAEYAFNEKTDIGLLYIDNGDDTPDADLPGDDLGNTLTLYGSYEVAPMTTINGYVANNDGDDNDTDNAYGIGGAYDLGGAMLAGSIQRGYDETITADAGVQFNF